MTDIDFEGLFKATCITLFILFLVACVVTTGFCAFDFFFDKPVEAPSVALGVIERSPSTTSTPVPVATTLPFVSALPNWEVSENPLSAIERRLDAIEKRLDALE